MSWISINDGLPKAFTRVWVKTSDGRQTTGYVNSSGEWVITCPRIAVKNPTVTAWRA